MTSGMILLESLFKGLRLANLPSLCPPSCWLEYGHDGWTLRTHPRTWDHEDEKHILSHCSLVFSVTFKRTYILGFALTMSLNKSPGISEGNHIYFRLRGLQVG